MSIYAFIDGTNLHLAIEKQGWKLDYRRFRRYLNDKHKVTKAFYFIGYDPRRRDLYEGLRTAGYKLKFKYTSANKQGEVKGNIDAELIVGAMTMLPRYDKAVLVSGDGDYYSLVKYLRRQGKLHKIIIPDRYNYSWLLRKFSSDLVFMNGMRSKLQYRMQ